MEEDFEVKLEDIIPRYNPLVQKQDFIQKNFDKNDKDFIAKKNELAALATANIQMSLKDHYEVKKAQKQLEQDEEEANTFLDLIAKGKKQYAMRLLKLDGFRELIYGDLRRAGAQQGQPIRKRRSTVQQYRSRRGLSKTGRRRRRRY